MLEELFNLVKQQGQEAVVNNPEVPNEKNGEVLAEATNSIAGGLQNILAGGGLQSILGLFGKGGNSQQGSSGLAGNPIVSMITGHFMSKLMGKFGLNNSAASGIAGSLIPQVLGGLINKTNDPANNGFSLQGLLGTLMGGGAAPAPAAQSGASAGGFDLGGMLGKVMSGGLDQNNDGSTDFKDLMSVVTGGAQQAAGQRAAGGGGFMSVLSGLLGK
jgi:hypothetical protein